MAENNVLTGLIPVLYEKMNVVSRELTGFIPAVTLSATAERAALNQSITGFTAPAATSEDDTPTMVPAAANGKTFTPKALTLSKAKKVRIPFAAEEVKSLEANGIGGVSPFTANAIEEAYRTILNEFDSDIGTTAMLASRAYGAAATAPFGTNLTEAAYIRKILVDNGAGEGDLQLVIDTIAGAKMRSLTQLNSANSAGNDSLLRQGVLGDIMGLTIRESAHVKSKTAGTMANATTTAVGYAVGATRIYLTNAVGTGVVSAGDVVYFGTDTTNKYVISAVSFAGANPATGDYIDLQAPGLMVALSAAQNAITVTATHTCGAAFKRSAIWAGFRPPARDMIMKDQAIDWTLVTDPRTGLTMEAAIYPGHGMAEMWIRAVWGTLAFKNEHIARLIS